MKIDTELYNKMPKELQDLFEIKHEPDCPVKLLDEQSGELKSGIAKRSKSGGKTFGGDNVKPPMEDLGYSGKGGASRFFYVAKASKKERNAGCEGLPKGKDRNYGGGKGMNKRCKKCQGWKFGEFNTCKCENPEWEDANKHPLKANNHPTVKPLKLMEYLCTLTKTPTGGIVLDPFAGSGTTGLACQNTDRDFIGIEREEEYVKIAEARLKFNGKQEKLI